MHELGVEALVEASQTLARPDLLQGARGVAVLLAGLLYLQARLDHNVGIGLRATGGECMV